MVVEFKEEVKSGGLLTNRAPAKWAGRCSLSNIKMCYLMGNVHATVEVVSVMFYVQTRQTTALLDGIRGAAESTP